MLRIPDDKICQPHEEYTYTADKASPSEKIEGRCMSKAVEHRFLAKPTIATGVNVSSSALDSMPKICISL